MALTLTEYIASGADGLQRLADRLLEPVPIRRRPSGRGWACETGVHRYHRDERAARWCAWRALPLEQVTTHLLAGVRRYA